MGYLHIDNLYKNKDILQFKRCIALEKINGTSAHIMYKVDEDKLIYFSGGACHENFLNIFNHEALLKRFRDNCKNHIETKKIVIYGEAYGAKVQGMKSIYGLDLKFIAFDVLIELQNKNKFWLSVGKAHNLCEQLGFEFVYYVEIDTTEEAINEQMMADSVQAIRNGMGEGHMREGIVLRPIIEFTTNKNERIICKHKRKEFSERKNVPNFLSEEDLKILDDANEIAEEWVTEQRFLHVLDKFYEDIKIENISKIIKMMQDDVLREADGEIVIDKNTNKAIARKTVQLFKDYLMHKD